MPVHLRSSHMLLHRLSTANSWFVHLFPKFDSPDDDELSHTVHPGCNNLNTLPPLDYNELEEDHRNDEQSYQKSCISHLKIKSQN